MSARIRLALVLSLSLGLAAVVMLGLPLLYLTLPNPEAVPVDDIMAAGRGIYLLADGGTLRLFPLASRAAEVPESAPPVSEVESVVVAVRQPGEEAEYRLSALSGRPVPADVTFERRDGLTLVRLMPVALDEGVYEMVLPRESMYGGEEYVYFIVTR